MGLPLAWRRGLVFCPAALLGCVLLYWRGLRPWLSLSRPERVAREIESMMGLSGPLSLLSAVEFLEGDLGPGVSRQLIQAHIDQVEQEIAGRKLDDLLPPKTLRSSLTALVMAGFLFGLLGYFAPQAFFHSLQSLWVGDLELANRVRPESWVGDIQLSYRYPAYSRREDRVVPASDGSILALPGTRVDMRLRSDRPVSAGRLEGLASGPVLLSLDSARELSGQLVVERSGSYRFVLQDAAGNDWRSSQARSVQLEVDRMPELRMDKPEQDRVVRADEAVELLFDASDDYGLSEVRLVWRVVGRAQIEQHRTLWRAGAQSRRKHRGALRWELAELELQPGEQLQFAVEGLDNDDVRGPKVGRSRAVTFKVFSAEERHQTVMAEVRAFWEHLLMGLADHLDGDGAVRQGDESAKEHLALAKGLSSLHDELAVLRGKLHEDALAWPPLVQALSSEQSRLRDMGRNLDFLLRPQRRSSIDGLKTGQARSLALARTQRIGQLEQDILYLEDLLDLDRFEDLERIGKELEKIQAKLTDLMERFRKAPTEQVRREIQAAIAKLKDQIARLMARQSEAIKSLRDEYLNPQALARMASEQDMQGALDKLQRLMNEGKVDDAMAELERLDKQLQGMRDALDSAKSSFGQQRYSELAKQVAAVRSELDQVAEQQKRLTEATGKIKERALARMRKRLEKSWPALRKKLLKQLDEVERQLSDLGEEGSFGYMRFDRDKALERASGLRQLLKADDAAGAKREASELTMYSERMEEGLKGEVAMRKQMGGASASLEAEMGRAAGARQGSSEILKALEAILPKPGQLLKGGERKQVAGMLGQQAELGRRMHELGQRMQKLNNKAPVFGYEMQLGVDQGRRHMQQAGRSLRRQDAPGAWPHQQAALQQLERMQEAMDKVGKQCEQGGMPLPMGQGMAQRQGEGPGQSMSREPVRIPRAEDYEPPEAFRRELLEGMKDPVPEAYKPQVRRYYEELVR